MRTSSPFRRVQYLSLHSDETQTNTEILCLLGYETKVSKGTECQILLSQTLSEKLPNNQIY